MGRLDVRPSLELQVVDALAISAAVRCSRGPYGVTMLKLVCSVRSAPPEQSYVVKQVDQTRHAHHSERLDGEYWRGDRGDGRRQDRLVDAVVWPMSLHGAGSSRTALRPMRHVEGVCD